MIHINLAVKHPRSLFPHFWLKGAISKRNYFTFLTDQFIATIASTFPEGTIEFDMYLWLSPPPNDTNLAMAYVQALRDEPTTYSAVFTDSQGNRHSADRITFCPKFRRILGIQHFPDVIWGHIVPKEKQPCITQ